MDRGTPSALPRPPAAHLERFQERQELVPLLLRKHKDIVQLDFLRLATVPADGFVDRQGRAVMEELRSHPQAPQRR